MLPSLLKFFLFKILTFSGNCHCSSLDFCGQKIAFKPYDNYCCYSSKYFLLLKCLLLTGKKWHQDKQLMESSASYCQWKEFHSENSWDNSYYQIAGWWVSVKESSRCLSLNRWTIPQLRGKVTIDTLSTSQIFVWIYNSSTKSWEEKKKNIRAV